MHPERIKIEAIAKYLVVGRKLHDPYRERNSKRFWAYQRNKRLDGYISVRNITVSSGRRLNRIEP